MKSPLHILHLEDDPNDAAIIRNILEAADIACVITRVESHDDYVAGLERGGFDLILSDCTLPAFDGIAALKIAQDKGSEVPFIFVSGTLGEERAIDSLKSGATDYVLKENLLRLVPATRRAMQEVEERDGLKRAGAELKTSQLRHRSLFDNMLEGYAYCRVLYEQDRVVDHIYVEVNSAFEQQTGLKNVVGKKVSEVIPGIRETNPELFEKYTQVVSTGKPERYESYVKSLDKWFSITIYSYEQDHFVGVFNNITERKRAEANLIRLAAIVESSDDAIIGKDMNGIVTSWNNGAEKLFGYTSAEMTGGTIQRLIPADRMAEDTNFLTKTTNVEIMRQFETQRLTKGGNLLEVSVTISPIKDVGGKLIGTSTVARDITEHKRLETRFRRLVDSNAQGVIFFNVNGEITGANDSFLHLTGYTREDLAAGRIGWSAMTPPEYAHLDRHALEQIAANGTCTPYEKEFISKSGLRLPVLLGAASFADNPDEGVCFILDLTARKKLEVEFRQSQKMEAFGQLAVGVAHDFNNILAVIQMQVGLMQGQGDLSTEQSEFVEEIGIAAQRAATLSHQLLLFSRKDTMHTHDLDLTQSINNMTKMLRRILGEEIQMQFKFSMESLMVHADPGMMDQVLMNLAVNSRDAMPRGGQLVVETSSVEFDESIVTQSAHARAGSFVCLSVSDTGGGIAPEILPKIFEPFFTTKEVGKGTGLGLATVFGIVQQHHGWIHVYSEVGLGTDFRIYLPRVAGNSDLKLQQTMLASPHGGNETILLVEDDAFLHASMLNTLLKLGYNVLEANNGAEAQKIWNQHRDKIHLLLTDLIMPGGISGVNLSQLLIKENPKLKVIFMSGYSAQIVGRDFPTKISENFLAKPFRTHKLAKTVRDRLDAAE